MFFLSVSLLIYAEERAVFDDEIDENEMNSGFIAIEISDVSPGLMKSFLPLTYAAYAGQMNDGVLADIPYVAEMEALLLSDDSFLYGSIILNTLEDGTTLPNDITISDLELLDDDLILSEKTNLWEEYIVKHGETLSDIVMKFSVTVQDIVHANELKNPNQLKEKQILLIPIKEEFVANTLEEVRIRKARVAALKEVIIPLEVSNYTVLEGDSLWSIANSVNLEVDTLIGSNTLGNVLRPNVVLRVPNQDGIFYKIKPGDTIQKVSSTYKVQIDRIKKVNPTVDLNSLKSGAELFIPGARIEAADTKETNKNNKTVNNRTANNKETRKQNPSGNKNINESSPGGFRWPVVGKISSPYGWRRHPILRRADFHSAIDINAPHGASIRASKNGIVAYSGWMNGYGNTVVIEHAGGYSTLYAHCSSLGVSKGKNVASGEIIAKVGATGRATGPHVHFEIRYGNKPLNPLSHLK